MTMTQVLYALEVARCQNVSRAAERLLLSQSALSQQLRRLEQELGYPIFTRTLHGVQLTPEGERFCEQAAGMARTWKEFQANVQKSALGIRKRLRIGMGRVSTPTTCFSRSRSSSRSMRIWMLRS